MEESDLAAQHHPRKRKGEENTKESKFEKDGEKRKGEKEGLLGLPENIIGHIFSFLSLKEAVRTSILARSWKYIWTRHTSHLDFDAQLLGISKRVLDSSRYVTWVNHVMKSIQAPTIDELRIRYAHFNSLKDDTDRWIQFAIDKRVQRLHLDLTNAFQGRAPREKPDIFPLHLCINNSNFGSLRELFLEYVDISGMVVEYILDKCSRLEKLSIGDSTRLIYLKVSSPSLKYLKIRRCTLMNLEIADPARLVSFTYTSSDQGKVLHPLWKVPSLTELRYDGFCATCINIIDKLPSHLPRLETLQFYTGFHEEHCKFPDNFPSKFENLKHLVLKTMFGGDRGSLFCFTSLLKACPALRKLTLEIPLAMQIAKHVGETNKEEEGCYGSLEVVEINGFNGSEDMVEFIFHLVQNAKSLKQIIINPHLFQPIFPEERQIARQRSMELGTKLPTSIEFVLNI